MILIAVSLEVTVQISAEFGPVYPHYANVELVTL